MLLPLSAQQRPEMVTQGGGSMNFNADAAPIFGPQQRWVVSVGGSGSVLLVFERSSGRLARSIETNAKISSIAPHPLLDEVVVAGDDKAGEDKQGSAFVAVYNVVTGKMLWKAGVGTGCLQARFNGSGAEALAYCAAGPLRKSAVSQLLRWNAADGTMLPPLPFASVGYVNVVSEDGQIASSMSFKSLGNNASIKEMRKQLRANAKKPGAEADKEDSSLMGGMNGMAATFVETTSGKTLGSTPGMVQAISSKAHTAVVASGAGLFLMDIAGGKPLVSLGSFFQQSATGYLSAAVSPDGSSYVLAGIVRVTVVDAASGAMLREIADDVPYSLKWAISPDNTEVAAAQGSAVMVFDLAQKTHRVLGDQATVMMPGSVLFKSMASEISSNSATERMEERKLEREKYAAAEAKAHGHVNKEMRRRSDELARQDAADQPRADLEASNKKEIITSMTQYMGTVGAVMSFPPVERFLDHGRLLAVRSADGGWAVWDTATGNPLPYRKPLGDVSRYEQSGENPGEFLDEADLRGIEENLGVRPKGTVVPGSVEPGGVLPGAAAQIACSSVNGDHWVEYTRNGKKLSGALLKSSDGTTVDLIARGVDLSSFSLHGFMAAIFEESETRQPSNAAARLHRMPGEKPLLCSLSPSGDRLVVEIERPEAEADRKAKVDAQHMGMYSGSMLRHSFSDSLVVYNASDGRRLCELENPSRPAAFDLSVGEIIFSPDSKRIAAGGRRPAIGRTEEHRALYIWEAETCRQTHLIKDTVSATPVGFSEDDTLLFTGMTVPELTGAAYGVHVWNAATGAPLFDVPDAAASGSLVALGPGGKTLLAPDRSNALGIWSAIDGNRLGMLRPLPQGEWLVTAPSGLFDGSPRGWNQIAWRDPDGLNTESAEVFFADFYRPGLFAELLDGHPLPLPRSFAKLDRRQPAVALTSSVASTVSRTVPLRIEVAEAGTGETGGGVRDVRLFRNGILIKAWRGEVALQHGKAVFEAEEPVVAGTNHFTAYAFNHDNVKSVDAAANVEGSAPPRPGTAFLLLIGVNEYANGEFNLRYAAPDATLMGEALEKSQQKVGRYQNIVRVALLDNQATRANVMLALDRLSGRSHDQLPPGAPSVLAGLRAVQPEDSVMIYFAGHGIAWQDHFYLIPSDLGYSGSRSDLAGAIEAVLEHSISDVQLETALEPLDAGHILLVIDACNSGKALDAEEQRRGPMNTRGLAQLAYEKGIDVLTASQSYQAALESSRLGHGYLTYALAEEGLTLADTTPVDGKVTAPEWFEYASSRVPQLQIAALREGTTAGRQLTFESATAERPGQGGARLQTPRFYYRRDAVNKENIISTVP